MTSTLFYNGSIYCPSDPFATAVLVDDGLIVWIGNDGAAKVHRSAVDDAIDMNGRLLTPAFVDSHLHITSTGLAAVGIDVTGKSDVAAICATVTEAAGQAEPGEVLIGFGWDETTIAEQRPPTAAELQAAAPGHLIILDRTDLHSSVVSTEVLERYPHLATMHGFSPDGWLGGAAHDEARSRLYGQLSARMRRRAHEHVYRTSLQMGICQLHEMGGPDLAGQDDFSALMTGDTLGVDVRGYWASLHGVDEAVSLGAHGVGGDLFIDGSIGSHSALMREPYADQDTYGDHYVSVKDVADFIIAATTSGLQAGFHVIGDAAIDIALAGFAHAESVVGIEALRRAHHRLEHVECVHPDQIPRMSHYGITAVMQPLFDEEWGGAEGLYAQRLGDRWHLMNPFADLVSSGVSLALSSDSPVTGMNPWAVIRAAAFHHRADQRLSVRAAFAAHTRGGHRAAGEHGGVIALGARADLALWEASELIVQTPDERIAGWSTDPRSGTPGLPNLAPGIPLPACSLTMVGGTVRYRRDEP